MRLKIFEAANIMEAMEEVRRTLGDDAIIVDNQTVSGGVRISVAIDSELSASNPLLIDRADGIDSLYELLDRHGVPLAIIEKLTGATLALNTDDMLLALGAAFDEAFSFHPIHGSEEKRILLIGPAGQGKTVTAARLAARAVLAQEPVRLIAADVGRAGAFSQLTELCRPMGITPEPLDRVTAGGIAKGLTIIDGPAINPFDPSERDLLDRLIAATEAEPVLVAAAGGDVEEARETAMVFKYLSIRRFIATRLDTTRRLGGVLAMADAGLAIAEASVGRTLADTLVSFNPLALARLFVAAAQQRGGRPNDCEAA